MNPRNWDNNNDGVMDEQGEAKRNDAKREFEHGKATWYVRDANGQVLAVYERLLHWVPSQPDACWPEWVRDAVGKPDPTKDPDDDGVTQIGGCDNCPGDENPWQEDYDMDGVGDACDNCPKEINPGQGPCMFPRDMELPTRQVDMLANWRVSEVDLRLAELHIYGNSAGGRIGMYMLPRYDEDSDPSNDHLDNRVTTELAPDLTNGDIYVRQLTQKRYEMKDHLGNVRVVISDLKAAPSGRAGPWEADILSWNNYYPFGMAQPDRHGNTEGYRYGFNGKEMDNEVKENPTTGTSGVGNHYDYGARGYDPRSGRWWSVDPLFKKYPSISSYAYVANSPIQSVDPDGREIRIISKDPEKRKQLFTAIQKLTNEDLVLLENGLVTTFDIYREMQKDCDAGNCNEPLSKLEYQGSASKKRLRFGTELVSDIMKSERLVGILEKYGDSETRPKSRFILNKDGKTEEYISPRESVLKDDGTPGAGTSSMVLINVDDPEDLVEADGVIREIPIFILVGHELIHARNNLLGITRIGIGPKMYDPDNPPKPGQYRVALDQEEVQTRKDENILRKEHNIMRRKIPNRRIKEN